MRSGQDGSLGTAIVMVVAVAAGLEFIVVVGVGVVAVAIGARSGGHLEDVQLRGFRTQGYHKHKEKETRREWIMVFGTFHSSTHAVQGPFIQNPPRPSPRRNPSPLPNVPAQLHDAGARLH